MKLQAEFENIKKVFSLNINKIKEYAPCLKASGDYKDFETRLTWECLHAFVGCTTICKWYEQYNCNNTHITTVGKRALKELGVI